MYTRFLTIILITLLLFSCSSKLELSLTNLENKDVDVRIDTLENLRDENAKEFKEVFLKAFNDENSDVLWRAIDISGRINDKEIILKLIGFLSSDNPLISYSAKDSLIKIGAESESLLLNNFHKYDDKTKILILKCLNKIGTFETVNHNFISESEYVNRYIKRTFVLICERWVKKEIDHMVSDLINTEVESIKSKD